MSMKPALHLALCLVALVSLRAHAQSVTIPARSFTQAFTINGKQVKLRITVPQQIVAIPAPTLPAGLTFSKGVLTVAGSIQATSIDLTGGSALPTSASGLYLLQLTGGFLQPVPYVPYTPPPPSGALIVPGMDPADPSYGTATPTFN